MNSDVTSERDLSSSTALHFDDGTELSKAKSLTPPSLLKQEVHAVVSVAAAVIGVDTIISVTWSTEESDVLTGVMKFDAASL